MFSLNKTDKKSYKTLKVSIGVIRENLEMLKLALDYMKDVKEVRWMSQRVIHFWFLLNFLFISDLFDILSSSSISRVFSNGFSDRQKSSCLETPGTIIKCHYINEI